MKDFQQIDYCTSAQDYITCMKAQVLKMLFFCLFVCFFHTPVFRRFNSTHLLTGHYNIMDHLLTVLQKNPQSLLYMEDTNN